MRLNIIFTIFILSRYMSNLSLKHFQILKKLYRYLLKIKLVFKYTEISEIYIISGILSGSNIYLDIYSNSD